MGKQDKYLKGDWNVICDYCGKKMKQSQCRLTWDNFLVCSDTCWEPRQPQDFVRGKVDKQRVDPLLARPDDRQAFTETALNGAVAKGAMTATLDDAVAVYKTIGIETNEIVQTASGITGDLVTANGRVIFWTTVTALATKTVTFLEPIPYAADDGLVVFIATDGRFLDIGDVSASDL
jgi:hypothetical protein